MPASNLITAVATGALLLFSSVQAQDQPSFSPSNPPDTWQSGQTGTNQCTQKFGSSSQNSSCQTAYINSATDFCLFAPPEPNSLIADTERIEVAWCLQGGTGSRLIPSGTITSAHFVKTPTYVVVLGNGDLTKINVAAGDMGGELDPHGADGRGNPIGGLVYSNAFGGGYQQSKEWSMFISSSQYCFRACLGNDPVWNQMQCPHIYDVLGCEFNMPSNAYNNQGIFEDCQGEDGLPTGVYGSSTFYQDQGNTPAAHPAAASSMCSSVPAPAGGDPNAAISKFNGSGSSSSTSSSSSSSSTTTSSTTTSSMTIMTTTTTIQSPANSFTPLPTTTRVVTASTSSISGAAAGISANSALGSVTILSGTIAALALFAVAV